MNSLVGVPPEFLAASLIHVFLSLEIDGKLSILNMLILETIAFYSCILFQGVRLKDTYLNFAQHFTILVKRFSQNKIKFKKNPHETINLVFTTSPVRTPLLWSVTLKATQCL